MTRTRWFHPLNGNGKLTKPVGSPLRKRIRYPYLRDEVITRIKPLVHVFGHVHEGYGVQQNGEPLIGFVSASSTDEHFRIRYSPVDFTL